MATGVIINQTVDPSAGAGFPSGIGSILLRDNAGTGELWEKTGAGDTAWTLVGGGGTQDIAEVLTEGNDAGGEEVTNLGQVTVNPGPANLYGLLIESLAGFYDVYNAFLRVIDENGTEVINFDQGGIDLKSPAGQDVTHLYLSNTDDFNSADLSTKYGLEVRDGTHLAVINLGGWTGIQMGPFVPANNPDTSTGQIYYDDATGAPTFRWRGKDTAGTDFSGSLGGGGTPAADPGDIADPTLATAEDVALKLNALMAAMRTAGSLA